MYRAAEHIAAGSNTFDAFHAALSGGAIVSRDAAYDVLDGVERVRLEPDDGDDENG